MSLSCSAVRQKKKLWFIERERGPNAGSVEAEGAGRCGRSADPSYTAQGCDVARDLKPNWESILNLDAVSPVHFY